MFNAYDCGYGYGYASPPQEKRGNCCFILVMFILLAVICLCNQQ